MSKTIVYRTENIVNGKFYYGVTNGTRDSYLGSGKRLHYAINKYGKENFIRRTVKEFDNIKDAYAFEKLIVDEDFVKRSDCYNMKEGGLGGHGKGRPGNPKAWDKWNSKVKSGEVKHPSTGKKWSEETRRKIMEYRNNNEAHKIIYDGVIYNSIKEASRLTGISRYLIKKGGSATYG